VPEIFRPSGNRPLRYCVIDGERIRAELQEVTAAFGSVNAFVKSAVSTQIDCVKDIRVACNINITSGGGSYRWHYDRNRITAILYLNAVDGGATECYPRYRLWLGRRLQHWRLQQVLDRLLQLSWIRKTLGRQVLVQPAAGRLLLMRADRCLHSVRPVCGETERINIVMSFDIMGCESPTAPALNGYLYEQGIKLSGDPNYARNVF